VDLEGLGAVSEPLLTLTTDFGEGSPYVAAMKGVVLSLNPRARLLDLSHRIPPQDLRHAAFFLRSALAYFPPETLHVIVVDPGVGTERAALYVEAAGQRLLVPDNGCWTEWASGAPESPRVRRLAEPRYWRPEVSATFHGRDVFAPVAAHLSLGLDPGLLGPPLSGWARLEFPRPALAPDRLAGEVLFVDPFGNLLTNIPGEVWAGWAGRSARLTVGGKEVSGRARTYGEAPPGTPVALISSAGTLEVAVVQGSAARQLGLGAGAEVLVELRNPQAEARNPKRTRIPKSP
jgi:S-adenosyl-L-methionine hydrolase (adenosine-forming)